MGRRAGVSEGTNWQGGHRHSGARAALGTTRHPEVGNSWVVPGSLELLVCPRLLGSHQPTPTHT